VEEESIEEEACDDEPGTRPPPGQCESTRADLAQLDPDESLQTLSPAQTAKARPHYRVLRVGQRKRHQRFGVDTASQDAM
jgi:hypothetical protein